MDASLPLAEDPFWSVVAARHPELTIVRVPAQTGPPVRVLAADEHLLAVLWAELADLVGAAEQRLRTAVGGDDVPRGERDLVVGPLPDTVEVRGKLRATFGDGDAALNALAVGADAVRRTDGAVHTLDAVARSYRLRATWASATGVLLVRWSSPTLSGHV